VTAHGEIDELRNKKCVNEVPRIIFKKPFDGGQLLRAVNDPAVGVSNAGCSRVYRSAPIGRALRDVRSTYGAPARLKLNEWALMGIWTVEGEPAVLNEAEGRIVYRFHARDLNLVMRPGVPGTSVRIRVTIDGRSPGIAHGTDVDEMGYGTVSEPRTYQLIRQPAPIMDRHFEIEFLDLGVKVFDVTFG